VLVGVIVGVFVRVAVSVGVGVAVRVGVIVGVFVRVAVSVGIGVVVRVGVAMGVFVRVAVTVGVFVRVAVSEGIGVVVRVGVAIGVFVRVSVTVGVLTCVFVGVLVAVDDEPPLPPPIVITNCGGLAPSRLERLVAVLLVVSITKVYCPVPVTTDVTSTCVQLLAVIAPELPILLPYVGALLKLMVVSAHVPVVVCTA